MFWQPYSELLKGWIGRHVPFRTMKIVQMLKSSKQYSLLSTQLWSDNYPKSEHMRHNMLCLTINGVRTSLHALLVAVRLSADADGDEMNTNL